ncbi:MAG: hypothetical protein OXC13_10030 [Caldilineaceae bacterium]|nr:hypothetical protein [Caldilineaceae bacterium]
MTLAAAPVSQPDVSVSRADIASVRGRLWSYQARYAPFFGRRELRRHARAYLRGLPGDEPRKSIERMVLRWLVQWSGIPARDRTIAQHDISGGTLRRADIPD